MWRGHGLVLPQALRPANGRASIGNPARAPVGWPARGNMDSHACRACRGTDGHLVLDLGQQPACDYFPRARRPGPRPRVPAADVAVLIMRPGPVAGRSDRARRAAGHRAGCAVGSGRRRGGPGGRGRAAAGARAWWPSTAARTADRGWGCWPTAGWSPPGADGQADVDPGLLRHDARRRPARGPGRTRGPARARRRAAAAVPRAEHDPRQRAVERAAARALRLLLDHRADRHAGSRSACGPRTAWRFDLYGGTVLLAASRDGDEPGPDPTTRSRVAAGRGRPHRRPRSRPVRPAPARRAGPRASGARLAGGAAGGRDRRSWVTAPRPGRSRCCARRTSDHALLPAVIDASPAKQGLRMPGTDIPVAAPAELTGRRPPGRAAVRAGPDGRGPRGLPGGGASRRPMGRRRRHWRSRRLQQDA